jgi:hypothetical protein
MQKDTAYELDVDTIKDYEFLDDFKKDIQDIFGVLDRKDMYEQTIQKVSFFY